MDDSKKNILIALVIVGFILVTGGIISAVAVSQNNSSSGGTTGILPVPTPTPAPTPTPSPTPGPNTVNFTVAINEELSFSDEIRTPSMGPASNLWINGNTFVPPFTSNYLVTVSYMGDNMDTRMNADHVELMPTGSLEQNAIFQRVAPTTITGTQTIRLSTGQNMLMRLYADGIVRFDPGTLTYTITNVN